MTNKSMNRSEASRTISGACNAILQIVTNVKNTEKYDWKSCSQSFGLAEACQVAMLNWSSIVSTLSSTHEASDPSVHTENIVSSMASVMHTLLEYLGLRCLEEAERRNTDALNISGWKATTKDTLLGKELKSYEAFEHDRNATTKILKNIISDLKELETDHPKLLDTITGNLLHHVGEIMTLLLLDPFNQFLTSVKPIVSPVLTESLSHNICNTVSAARIEGPYLVELLACLVHRSQPKSTSGSEYEQYEKLQRKLLRAVLNNVNNDSVSRIHFDEDTERSVIKKYSIESMETGSEDWFLAQVWDLLGWDVLLDK